MLKKIDELTEANKVPIIEGGSGFYLNYLLTGNNQLYDDTDWDMAEIKAKRILADKKTWSE